MPFTPKDWKEDGTTPVSAASLEDIEVRVTSYADSLGGGGGSGLRVASSKTSSYTLVIGDASVDIFELNSSTSIALNIPTNASVAFSLQEEWEVVQVGIGTTTIAAVTPATTFFRQRGINSTSTVTLAGQWAVASLRQRATDEWVVVGDIV